MAETNADARAPLALFLHGFPEFWWAWRYQLPVLAELGYHAAAMDLRGYGASDKTPRGYDLLTLAADVSEVIQGLGARDAVLVGHGWGGYIAWTVATVRPQLVSRLCVVAAPHPIEVRRLPDALARHRSARHLLAMQVPWFPERSIMGGHLVAEYLESWSASGSFPTKEVADRYRAAMALWPSPHCALEYHRWLLRSRLRADGRAFAAAMRAQVRAPTLYIGGGADAMVAPKAVSRSGRHVTSSFGSVTLADVGHFPHEEDSASFNQALTSWLSAGTASGVDAAG